MAKFIPADENMPIVEVAPENGHDFKLKQLYELLSCSTIEVVNLPDCHLSDKKYRLPSKLPRCQAP